MSLVYGQDERVTKWVAEQLGHSKAPSACSSIGFEVDGQLQAGVFFDNMTATNMFAHIVSVAPTLPISLVAACALYAFEQVGVKRMTFMVADDNIPCIRLVVGLGARLESRLHGAQPNGDVLLFALWADTPLYQRLRQRGQDKAPA